MTSKIVVGYDGSPAARKALAEAVALAKELAGGEIILVCGHDRRPGWLGYEPLWKTAIELDKLWGELEGRIQAELEEAAAQVRESGVAVGTACSRGSPAALLVSVARDVGARMVVVGARGAGAGEELTALGSITTELLHAAHVPVLVVPD